MRFTESAPDNRIRDFPRRRRNGKLHDGVQTTMVNQNFTQQKPARNIVRPVLPVGQLVDWIH